MVISPLIKRLMHLDTLSDDDGLAGAAEAGLEAQEGGVKPATKA
jgi:POT family proton-dependent oligopeptide transporter